MDWTDLTYVFGFKEASSPLAHSRQEFVSCSWCFMFKYVKLYKPPARTKYKQMNLELCHDNFLDQTLGLSIWYFQALRKFKAHLFHQKQRTLFGPSVIGHDQVIFWMGNKYIHSWFSTTNFDHSVGSQNLAGTTNADIQLSNVVRLIKSIGTTIAYHLRRSTVCPSFIWTRILAPVCMTRPWTFWTCWLSRGKLKRNCSKPQCAMITHCICFVFSCICCIAFDKSSFDFQQWQCILPEGYLKLDGRRSFILDSRQ